MPSSWTIQGLEVGQCLCNFATAVTRVYSAWGNVHPSPKSRENSMFSRILLYWSFLMYRHFCNQWVVRFLCMRLTVWCTGYFSWRRHQMKTVSALLAICAVKSPHKGQWRGTLMFSLIRTRINGSVNNGEAGDLRRYRAHYDVTVMYAQFRVMLSMSQPVYEGFVCVNVDWYFIFYLRSQSFFSIDQETRTRVYKIRNHAILHVIYQLYIYIYIYIYHSYVSQIPGDSKLQHKMGWVQTFCVPPSSNHHSHISQESPETPSPWQPQKRFGVCKPAHHTGMTWAPTTPRFVQQFMLAKNKEIWKVRISGPLWKQSTGDQGGFPSQKASNVENVSISGCRHVDCSGHPETLITIK